jgi:hypothetical protein
MSDEVNILIERFSRLEVPPNTSDAMFSYLVDAQRLARMLRVALGAWVPRMKNPKDVEALNEIDRIARE